MGTNQVQTCPGWFFRPVVTNYGRCFTFNGDAHNSSLFNQTQDGGGYGLTVMVHLQQEEYTGAPCGPPAKVKNWDFKKWKFRVF